MKQGGGAIALPPRPSHEQQDRMGNGGEVGSVRLPQLLTVPEVAAVLRSTPKAIYAKVERGEIPNVHIGRRVLFREDELVQWLRGKSIPITTERAA